MNRRRHLPLVIAAVLGCMVTAAPAHAAHEPGGLPPLTTRLKYDPVTWTSQGADMSIMAPRGWPLVLTPDGQARFNADSRPDVLTMGYRGDGALSPELKDKIAALRGTPGLRILKARAHGAGDSARGDLRYLWTAPGRGTRFVAYRYVGDDAYMVAGPLADRQGLKAVLDTASITGDCS